MKRPVSSLSSRRGGGTLRTARSVRDLQGERETKGLHHGGEGGHHFQRLLQVLAWSMLPQGCFAVRHHYVMRTFPAPYFRHLFAYYP